MSEAHAAFEWLRSSRIPSLNVEVQEYRHRSTGALHIHLAAEDDQNAFMVGFRTVPQDSTGVAHILEHTSLCGSERFPVRDPFFMMTRRSLNTFMNAFTSADWTAYPFASRNLKDYDNLLQVYLDAVFFPSLNELDFLQEGHRVEFAEADNPDAELVFKGVVFNEMKGAMSSPVSTLWQVLGREVFPTITYHHNSGGDPEHIPDLSYDELKAFHARHYHPANAVFITYGNLPAAGQQARFDELALTRFEPLQLDIAVPDEQRFSAPRVVEERYALDGETDTHNKSHVVLGWLLGKSTDMEAVLEAHLLSGVLLDNGASPLRHALETTELGNAPSPLCGLSDSSREMLFACGIEGSNPESAEAVEQLILETLHEVAENGVEQEMVEAVLHQLELHQREVGGDGFPFGLQLMVNALGPVLHGADAAEVLDIDPILEKLRERIQKPDYIKSLARALLDNPHRVRLTLRPDTGLSAEREAAEKARLAAMKAAMSEDDKQRVITRAAELAERQQSSDDPEQLPKVGLEDVPTELAIPEGKDIGGDTPSTWFSRGTNGLFYQQLIIDLPELAPELLALVPLYADIVTEVGSGERDYLATQALQSAVTGGLSAGVSQRSAVDRLDDGRAIFTFSGKALARNRDALSQLLQESFENARLDELPRIRELVAQERMHQEQGVTQRGHALAMSAAAAGMSRAAQRLQQWHGLRGIQSLKSLDESLEDNNAIEALAGKFAAIQEALRKAPRRLLLIGEEELHESALAAQAGLWGASGGAVTANDVSFQPERIMQAWSTSSQVNFCARAYPTVPVGHEDAAALMVLGGFLRNNFLHRAIREQGGAYGGGASYDSDSGAFRFYSYRDPRLAETLTDFDASITWLLENKHEWRLLEEAILGVISSIDKPGSPAGEAKKSFHAALHGRTPEQRRRLRARILEVSEADLKRVAERYLTGNASTAVIGAPDTLKGAADELELELIQL